MNELKKTQKEMLETTPTIFQEKYETPTTEVIEMELEGIIASSLDNMSNGGGAW